jgi:hypothetical protein
VRRRPSQSPRKPVFDTDEWALEFWVLISRVRDLPTDSLAELTAYAEELDEDHEKQQREEAEAAMRNLPGRLLQFPLEPAGADRRTVQDE